ncbi:MAG: PAS domain-containing protein [Bacteroidales bacterium]|nr:PAS domain-containing protein [Bacteroidales bacterium]
MKEILPLNLKVLSERFEIAANSARIGIWEWDLLTHKVFWDKMMFELYNVDKQNYKETIPDWLKNLHPDDAVRFEEELHHSIRHKINHKTSYRIKNKQQGYKNIRCYFNIITDVNGKAIRVTGVNWDITERVLLESELVRAKESSEEKIRNIKECCFNLYK